MNERARHAAALHVGGQDMEKVQGTIKQFVRDWSAGVREHNRLSIPVMNSQRYTSNQFLGGAFLAV